jgi:hypothetical protein
MVRRKPRWFGIESLGPLDDHPWSVDENNKVWYYYHHLRVPSMYTFDRTPLWVEIPEDSPGVIEAKRRCGVA